MSVLVDKDTRLAVAGITGKEGSFHTLNNRRYGTNVVGGVTPGKGGQDVEGIPVFDRWADAARETQPNTAMIFVPPRFAADAILEAAAAGVALVIAITEGIPAHDELRVYNTLKRDHPDTRLIGPNCPGILSPGKANVGIIPASFFREGNVGVVSRSGTLTYQIGNEIARAGFGNSSIVGIGGDAFHCDYGGGACGVSAGALDFPALFACCRMFRRGALSDIPADHEWRKRKTRPCLPAGRQANCARGTRKGNFKVKGSLRRGRRRRNGR